MGTSTVIFDLSVKPRTFKPGQMPTSETCTLTGGARRHRELEERKRHLAQHTPSSNILSQYEILSLREETLGGCQTSTIDLKSQTRTLTVRFLWNVQRTELDYSVPSWQPCPECIDGRMLVIEASTLDLIFAKLALELSSSA